MYIGLFDDIDKPPQESKIERYLIINSRGETMYAYWKILYEKISEESLYNDYNLKNLNLEEKGRTKDSIDQNRSGVSNKRRLTVCCQVEEEDKSERLMPCFDDMDIFSSKYRRLNKKGSSFSECNFYVPIAICIKTYNPHIEQADNILESVVSFLFSKGIKSIQHLVFSYAIFSSAILKLSTIITPPPFTKVIVQLFNRQLTYSQGSIATPNFDGDLSIINLFLLLKIKQVIILWTALLLEKKVVIYTRQSNTYFYITKALTHLIFPLEWQHAKGIISQLELLATPIPYCFGIVKANSISKEEIINDLEEEDIEYIFVNLDDTKDLLTISIKNMPKYLYYCTLKENLKSICRKYNVSPGLVVGEVDSKKFGREVEAAFADEMNKLVNGFNIAIGECKANTSEFKECFLKLYFKSRQCIVPEDEYLFMEEFISTQAVACFYDGIFREKESSCLRTQEMKPIDPTFVPNTMVITHELTAADVVKKLSQMAEIVVSERLITKSDLFTEKFDWYKEIEILKNSPQSIAETLLRETSTS